MFVARVLSILDVDLPPCMLAGCIGNDAGGKNVFVLFPIHGFYKCFNFIHIIRDNKEEANDHTCYNKGTYS